MSTPLELKGRRFGRLQVLDRAPPGKRRGSYWKCLCDCGTLHTAFVQDLVTGGTSSCGCLSKETKRNYVHGLFGTRTYQTWHLMMARCYNPKDRSYPRYGGRGIAVCERWHDLLQFVGDVGERPAGLTLGRINNDGNYEPGNVRWEAPTQQANNRRSSRLATIQGATKTHAQWCREFGVKPATFCTRLKRGWSVEEALGIHPRTT